MSVFLNCIFYHEKKVRGKYGTFGFLHRKIFVVLSGEIPNICMWFIVAFAITAILALTIQYNLYFGLFHPPRVRCTKIFFYFCLEKFAPFAYTAYKVRLMFVFVSLTEWFLQELEIKN